jgi:hypothetical protein
MIRAPRIGKALRANRVGAGWGGASVRPVRRETGAALRPDPSRAIKELRLRRHSPQNDLATTVGSGSLQVGARGARRTNGSLRSASVPETVLRHRLSQTSMLIG